jgi:hypothetical protein
VVQLSAPAAIVAVSAEEALDFLFAGQVIDPQMQAREPLVTKLQVVTGLRSAYRRASVDSRFIAQRPELHVGAHVHTTLDFAVITNSALQITQGWSFKLTRTEDLPTSIKAWAFAIGMLRGKEEARILSDRAQVSPVGADVDIQVVVAEPQTHEQVRVYTEAQQVFQQVGATVRPLEEADHVATRAAELIALAAGV